MQNWTTIIKNIYQLLWRKKTLQNTFSGVWPLTRALVIWNHMMVKQGYEGWEFGPTDTILLSGPKKAKRDTTLDKFPMKIKHKSNTTENKHQQRERDQ